MISSLVSSDIMAVRHVFFCINKNYVYFFDLQGVFIVVDLLIIEILGYYALIVFILISRFAFHIVGDLLVWPGWRFCISSKSLESKFNFPYIKIFANFVNCILSLLTAGWTDFVGFLTWAPSAEFMYSHSLSLRVQSVGLMSVQLWSNYHTRSNSRNVGHIWRVSLVVTVKSLQLSSWRPRHLIRLACRFITNPLF